MQNCVHMFDDKINILERKFIFQSSVHLTCEKKDPEADPYLWLPHPDADPRQAQKHTDLDHWFLASLSVTGELVQ
jgi:hypothetical protein